MSKKSKNREEPIDQETGEVLGDQKHDQVDVGQGFGDGVDLEEFLENAVEATGEDTPEDTLEQQLETAREEAQRNNENFLLASAEAENTRKRAQNEIATVRKFANEKFASELLSVRDSLDLASSTEFGAEDSAAVEKMREGLALTLKQLDAVFEKFNISIIDPKGEKFNPDHHQAMAAIESQDLAPNHVIDVMQKGYLLNDRLLRPAMVVVSKAPAEDVAN